MHSYTTLRRGNLLEGKLSLPRSAGRVLVVMVRVSVVGKVQQMVAATGGREGAEIAHRRHCAGQRRIHQEGRIRATGHVLRRHRTGTMVEEKEKMRYEEIGKIMLKICNNFSSLGMINTN